ncbi:MULTISPECIES: ABC transporter substrate-binding protein [Methylomonas]|uniref:NitT/TauT family transport system substrate-binding protein n=2 Tax=Methylomonas TaxID=416 RepID=A0ABY2CG36_METMH|nr:MULTISPECIES: ABC transporter substrate-binding protein [Methylomonas]AMK76877.1 nitrate ABC transporter substrate-binding protein [Methylomonas denitrificans]OAI01507.1 nitrate ABC transporter substrate-binding protein [Methylomonas methanica]TCV74173.1 NitT/TauT family transport system substrate-binding protein [Methylomonas methanica]
MKVVLRNLLLFLGLLASDWAFAEKIRIAIGTQDTTINCAAGGLLIRELQLLEKHLPHDGKYQNAEYDIQWHNFTSGAPLTNEMVAGKLDIGSMADFPGAFNIEAFRKAGKKSLFINVLSGSPAGSGNGVVVPKDSAVQSLAELKGKTISVPFASTAHGMLLRAVAQQGWNPEEDVNIITQAPEIAGSALLTHKVDAHADFVPFAELFPYRGFARKIYDGAQSNTPTFHGTLADADFAEKYPELVVAFLRAALEANQLLAAEPEKYSELIAKHTGIEAEVAYLFHGPLGVQTRDFTWKPEYRQAVKTAFETLKLLKRTSTDLDVEQYIDDRHLRTAFKQNGLDYDAKLKDYSPSPIANAVSGQPITDFKQAVQIWINGEPTVRNYASAVSAFAALNALQKAGKTARAVYLQDKLSGIKLLANDAWFVLEQNRLSAFLSKEQADAQADQQGGRVLDFAGAQTAFANPSALATAVR